MELYFVTATYTNNVYKLDDFFTGSAYKQVATKKLDLNFKADDGVTSIITPLVTPDDVNIRTYTHVIVPSQEKIYKIISADYHNTNQYFLTLDDDPLIANYQTLKDKNIIINRTNDDNFFNGIIDVAEIVTKKKTSISRAVDTYPKSLLGPFALLFFQADVTGLELSFGFSRVNESVEVFPSVATVLATYPEVATNFPDSYTYFLKTVLVLGSPSDDGYYQCILTNEASRTLRWHKVVVDSVPTMVITSTSPFPHIYRSSYSDIRTIVVAMPLRRDIYDASGSKMACYFDLDNINKPESLIDIKIVPDYFIKYDSYSNTYNPTTRASITSVNFKQADYIYSGIDDDYFTVVTSGFMDNLNVSKYPLTFQTNYAPFTRFYLQVFGNRIEVSPKYHDKLKMYFNITTGIINYVIYYDTRENIIATGSFTNQAKWFADQLDRFYEQNPTYKDQFYLKMAADSIKTIAGGAVGGSVIPGIGTVVGAVSGLGSALLDAGLSQINLNMQEKSLRLQPDQINGNNTDLSVQLANIFGIFWIVEEVDGDINGLNQMKTEYNLRGYPTSIVKKITELTAYTNDIFGSCKIVYGELKEVVKNNYVTGFINAKLQGGVVII